MDQVPKRRMRGACQQCAKRKRKCDHKHPRCSQCIKHAEICQPRIFKNSTQSGFTQIQSQNLFINSIGTQSLSHSSSVDEPTPSPPLELSAKALDVTAGPIDADGPTVPFSILSDEQPIETPEIPSFSLNSDLRLLEYDGSNQDPPELRMSPGNGQPRLNDDASLSIYHAPMPWPEDMLVSPERRFLWQHFLSIIESEYLCVDWEDVGHLYNFQHPYTTTLPQMALSNAALRGAVLCFSASQYELKYNKKTFTRTKALACSQAVQSMRNQILQQASDEGSLLSMIFAASILHYFGTERHNYLRIASNLVPKFLERWRPLPNTSSIYPEISLTEFRWGLITSLCSLQQPGTPLDDLAYRMIEMSDREINQKFSQAFESWVSHPIYMFSPRLINPLLRMGQLLEKQLLGLYIQEPDSLWETKVTEVEEMLLRARESDVKVLQSPPGCGDPAAVLALNESMYAACAILLYARIHSLPFTAPFVRRQAQLVVDEIAKIDVNSRVSYAIVFPLFVAGCEAVEPQVRTAIRQRLREPQGVSYDRGDMIGALDHIWEMRDLSPGLLWPEWAEKLEPQYRVNCLM